MLTLDNWSYLQKVDYEKITFKCKSFHAYGNFSKGCPKALVDIPKEETNEQWQ
jgi:hypothetical protein